MALLDPALHPAISPRITPRISVVIPHLNQPEALARCLASLAQGRRRPDQIFVVDNGSKSLPEAVCAGHPGVTLLFEATPGPGPLRACFIGRLVPYKGPDMLLAAAAPLLRDGRLVIDMIGDGPMMPALRAQVQADGTASAVNFHGWLAHADVQTIAAQNSVFAFPSIREFGGGVVLEAMALGLVPLIVNYAGPGELVTPDIGRKVPLGDRAAVISGFRAELEHMAANPAALIPLAANARARVQAAFTWPRKAAQVAQVYDWVLKHRVEKPDFDADLTGAFQPKDSPDV